MMSEYSEGAPPEESKQAGQEAGEETPLEVPPKLTPAAHASPGKSPTVRWVIAAGMLALLVTLAVAGTIAYRIWSQPNPRELLVSVLAAYEAAETYQAEGNIITDTNMMGMRYKMAYQKPNLLYAEHGQGMQASQIVCDGQDVYMKMGMFSRVAKAPAPEGIKDLQECTGGMSGFGPGVWTRAVDASKLIEGEFPLEVIESIEAGFDQGNEWLVSLEQPEGTWAITLAIPDAPSMVLWIDKSTRVLRQVAMEMGSEDMTRMMEQAYEDMPEEIREEVPEDMEGMFGEAMGEVFGEQMGEEFGELMTEMMKDMEIKTVIVHDRAVLGEPVPEGTFTYTPPADVEVVEAESVLDMHGALLEGFMDDMPWMPDWNKPKGMKGE